MRLFLLAASLFVAVPAFAQPQAGAPVELILQSKRGGTPANPLVVLSVSQALPLASLPATCADGALVLVTDGRTPAQPAGSGTGVVARCQGNAWISLIDGKGVAK